MSVYTDTLLLEQAAAEEIGRAARISARWRAYHGIYPDPLPSKPGKPDATRDNVIVNFARVIVDKGVSFLFGSNVSFEIDELESTDAEQWLDACWMANRKMLTLQKLAVNGAIAGHAFVKIVPARPYPRLIVLDPATVTVRWEPDDIERVVEYKIQFPARNPETRRPTVFRQLIQRDKNAWAIIDQVSSDNARWTTVSTMSWPYEWPPIVDCQNLPCPNEYWGISDLENDVLSLNASINFVLSNIVRILRHHAHPKTWGRGFTASNLSIAADETIVFPSAEAELHNLEMQSDLASSLDLYARLREALHEVSRIPEVATGKLESAGPLSGVALQILYQPLIEKTETKRQTYGGLLVELNRRLLALGGFGENVTTAIHWPSLLPSDPLQDRNIALLDRQLGVSVDTLLQKLGYDPDLEREKQARASGALGEQLLTAFDQGQGV